MEIKHIYDVLEAVWAKIFDKGCKLFINLVSWRLATNIILRFITAELCCSRLTVETADSPPTEPDLRLLCILTCLVAKQWFLYFCFVCFTSWGSTQAHTYLMILTVIHSIMKSCWFLPQCFREPRLTIKRQLNYQRYHFWFFKGCIQNPLRNRRGHVPSQLQRPWCFCPSGVYFLSARLETQPTAGTGLPQQSPEPERVAHRVMMPLFESPRRFLCPLFLWCGLQLGLTAETHSSQQA